MKGLQMPESLHWWLSDGAYHEHQPAETQTYRPDQVPVALDQREPFREVERPEPVYVSGRLAQLMKEVVPVDRRALFEVREAPEVVQNFKTEIRVDSEDLPHGRAKMPAEQDLSHMTDETFTAHEEPEEGEDTGEGEELVREIDAHLVRLRARLASFQNYDPVY